MPDSGAACGQVGDGEKDEVGGKEEIGCEGGSCPWPICYSINLSDSVKKNLSQIRVTVGRFDLYCPT